MVTVTNQDREKALQEVKMYQSNDWELVEETPEYFLLKRNKSTLGWHIVIFIFFWWTLGLANLAYWALLNQKKKVIK